MWLGIFLKMFSSFRMLILLFKDLIFSGNVWWYQVQIRFQFFLYPVLFVISIISSVYIINNVSFITFEVHVILSKVSKTFFTHLIYIFIYSWWRQFDQIHFRLDFLCTILDADLILFLSCTSFHNHRSRMWEIWRLLLCLRFVLPFRGFL